MPVRKEIWNTLFVAVLGGCLTGAAAGQETATPQRPSLSFNAWTVPAGRLELEAGAAVANGGSAAPLFLKYGVLDTLEVELGFDAVRRVESATGHVTSFGDTLLGLRARLAGEAGEAAFAVSGLAKLPTAKEGAGSREPDLFVTGIASLPIRSFSLDLNLGAAALGREDGARAVGQIQGIATLNLPAYAGWSPFVEAAWQTTAGKGDGGFVDAGAAWSPTPRAVFDVAAGAGWSDGYPDWQVSFGWTILFAGR